MVSKCSEWEGRVNELGEMSGGGTDDGSRSEVRGFRNFEPGTSNFVSRLSCTSRLYFMNDQLRGRLSSGARAVSRKPLSRRGPYRLRCPAW